jgi:hypothetical protein
MNGYPKLFLPFLMNTTLILFVSGILLIPAFLLFRVQWDSDWLMDLAISSGDSREWITVIHALFGWIMLWLLGTLWSLHMRSHWRRNENCKNGALFATYWALIIFSSLGIYYFGNELLSQYSSILHVLLGVLMPIGLIFHRSKGKKSISKS